MTKDSVNSKRKSLKHFLQVCDFLIKGQTYELSTPLTPFHTKTSKLSLNQVLKIFHTFAVPKIISVSSETNVSQEQKHLI